MNAIKDSWRSCLFVSKQSIEVDLMDEITAFFHNLEDLVTVKRTLCRLDLNGKTGCVHPVTLGFTHWWQ